MGVRLNDGEKIGHPSAPKGKVCKIRGAFGGVGCVLANLNPVFKRRNGEGV